MPENQTQPRTDGYDNPQGGPKIGQGPEASEGPTDRPSDTEAAHAPQEGRTFTDAEVKPDRPDTKDRRDDYGGGNMGHSRPGTDKLTAGAEFADRLPDAASTPAVDGETGKKSPTS